MQQILILGFLMNFVSPGVDGSTNWSIAETEALCLAAEEKPGEIWLDVPFVPQIEELCGPACLAMIIRYWINQGDIQGSADNLDPLAIAKTIYDRQVKGTYGRRMEEFLRRQGFRTFIFQAGFDDLTLHLSRGRPLIVCVKPSRGQKSLHYLVVSGVNQEENVLLVNDPARRKSLKLSQQEFQRIWEPTRNWTLLAVPSLRSVTHPAPSP